MVAKRRPLIFVYDLPPQFNTNYLQGRRSKWECAPRLYDKLNRTTFNTDQAYGLEFSLHESLLSTPHRTTNPSEADFFFVPVYASCVVERMRGGGEASGINAPPRMSGNLAWFASSLLSSVQRHIMHSHPFWNQTGGRDHLWPIGLDEGACLAPRAIWRSTLLTHWGNTMAGGHSHSLTSREEEKWDEIPLTLRGGHVCFSPTKDLILPAWLPPSVKHLREQYWQRSFSDRSNLFFFAGDLGRDYEGGTADARFSYGIRQAVAALFASVPNKKGSLSPKHESGVVVTNVRVTGSDLSLHLGNSRFCGVFPSSGFTSDLEEAMRHGCIPVIVQDGIELPFQTLLDYNSFSIRLAEREIPKLVTTLKAISSKRGSAMQRVVAAVWQRLSYHSLHSQEARRQQERYGHNEAWAFGTSMLKGDDAITTLIQALHYKLHNDKWRRIFNFKQSREELQKIFGVPRSCLVT